MLISNTAGFAKFANPAELRTQNAYSMYLCISVLRKLNKILCTSVSLC